jgi:delta-aminolevulinic acid dehydratase/porphobilinogen synthase
MTFPVARPRRLRASPTLREVALVLDEGADMVMVKPALAYLDIVRRVRESCTCRWPHTTSAASTA